MFPKKKKSAVKGYVLSTWFLWHHFASRKACWAWLAPRYISLWIFHCNSNPIPISFCYHPKSDTVIATIFRTHHDSTAVMQCTKIWSNLNARNLFIVKQISNEIWITMQKFISKTGLFLAFSYFFKGIASCEIHILSLRPDLSRFETDGNSTKQI